MPFAAALTKRGQIVVEEEAAKLRHCFQPTEGLSVYSEDLNAMFNRYNRGPRCGLLREYQGPVSGFDVSKAHTECMSLIAHIPVFSVFDVMVLTPISHPSASIGFMWPM